MALASARHILVEDEALCEDLKQQIADGADFADLAKEHSQCPSGRDGGALGEFGRGQLVPEFDEGALHTQLKYLESLVDLPRAARRRSQAMCLSRNATTSSGGGVAGSRCGHHSKYMLT